VVGAVDLDTILRTAADRTRMLVREGDLVLGSLHARDALVARAQGCTGTARTLARPVPELTEDTKVADATTFSAATGRPWRSYARRRARSRAW
jgi:hypothetical protein